ncbi:MAG TPA: DUF5678 domain-containing protein [Candidatus Andersenbacteria bacterium]|nr:DUF5678 domain-containing protein [Candidatus Andersenbacteria bacterium]
MPRKEKAQRPPDVDVGKYGGKWIAWDHHSRKVIASGRTFEAVHKAALKTGEKDPIFQKVPRADQYFIGHLHHF